MQEPVSALAANLTRISKSKGLSRQALAEATGLSPSKVGRIIRGELEPEPAAIRSLAKVLEVKTRDLFAPAPQLTHIRFRSKKTRVNVRQEVLVATAAWLRNFNELERLTDDHLPLRLELRRHGPESPKHAALRLRSAMGLEADEPVLDICGLLEHHGIKVFAQHKISEAFFGLSVAEEDGGPAIVVNCNPQISVERWIFSASHELGHLVLHRGSYQADEKEEIDEEEHEADRFAGHLLMPDSAFDVVWNDSKGLHPVDRVVKVKRHFTVSYKTVLRRLIDTSRTTTEVWKSFATLFKKRTGRSLKGHHEMEPASASTFRASFADEPERLNHLDFQPERLARLVREALDQELISTSRAADILGISLQEMRDLQAAWIDDLVTS